MQPKHERTEKDKYLLYIPEGLDTTRKYPLIVGFEPTGNASGAVHFWKDMAQECGLIVAVSKEFKNAINPMPAFDSMADFVKNEASQYPIDTSKVIAWGFSGGGMAAHMFSDYHREVTWAVITNSGYIKRNQLRRENKGRPYPKNKLAVFLVGRSGMNYKVMKEDKRTLDRFGWKTRWMEFDGGHAVTPKELYKSAIKWLKVYM